MPRMPVEEPREPSRAGNDVAHDGSTSQGNSASWRREPDGHGRGAAPAPLPSDCSPCQNSQGETNPFAAVQEENDADDSAIKEYVAALIARTQGTKPAAHAAAAAFARPADPPPPAQQLAGVAKERAATEPRNQTRRPQTRPPECRDAISELRELANINARSTFNMHRARQLIYEMHDKLAVTFVALVVSFSLLVVARNTRSLAFFSAVVASIVAMCWGVKYLRLGRQLHQLCYARKASGTSPSE